MEEQEELVALTQKQENIEDSTTIQSADALSESAPLLDGNELIDATQNAIVGAAENVSEALTLT